LGFSNAISKSSGIAVGVAIGGAVVGFCTVRVGTGVGSGFGSGIGLHAIKSRIVARINGIKGFVS